jgi:hypothetical protein
MKISSLITTLLTCGALVATVPIDEDIPTEDLEKEIIQESREIMNEVSSLINPDVSPELKAIANNLESELETMEHHKRDKNPEVQKPALSPTNSGICYERGMGIWTDWVLFVSGPFVTGDYGKHLERHIRKQCSFVTRWEFDYGNFSLNDYDDWKSTNGKGLRYVDKNGDGRASFRTAFMTWLDNHNCAEDALRDAAKERGGNLVWNGALWTAEEQSRVVMVMNGCRKIPWSSWTNWPLWRYRSGS